MAVEIQLHLYQVTSNLQVILIGHQCMIMIKNYCYPSHMIQTDTSELEKY